MLSTRVWVTGALALFSSLTLAGGAHGGFGSVAVNDDFFSLDDYQIGTGGAEFTFEWGTVNNAHNVRQDLKLFRSGPITDDDNESFPIKLTVGRYHFYCENHGSPTGGMDGEYRIEPGESDGPGDTRRIDLGHDDPGYIGNEFDVKFRVDGGRWRTWLTDTGKHAPLFGKRNKPVDFNPNKFYEIKARSQLKSNPKRHSAYSPILEIGVP